MPNAHPLAAADRLRSCLVAGSGFGFGLVFWLGWHSIAAPAVPAAGAPGMAPALFWLGLACAAMGYGLWRYLVQPVRRLARAFGTAEAAATLARLLPVCLPYGLLCGLLLLPLGAEVPITVHATILLVLVWGWDWMKARSQPKLAAALPDGLPGLSPAAT